jgi:hypothetical protein
MLVSCLAQSSTVEMEATFSSEMSFDFNGLHSVTLQKRELFSWKSLLLETNYEEKDETITFYSLRTLKWLLIICNVSLDAQPDSSH